MIRLCVGALALVLAGCARGGVSHNTSALPATGDASGATLAQIYFWRAKPGKVDEYTRYIRERAEPIDAEARRSGAFISVTTYQASDTTVPWSLRLSSNPNTEIRHLFGTKQIMANGCYRKRSWTPVWPRQPRPAILTPLPHPR